MAKETLASLGSLARGAAVERFDDALARVVENIVDPNTDADAAREITLKVKFKPNKSRTMAAFEIKCDPKLAPPSSVGGSIFVGERDGVAVATEYDPEQLGLLDAGRAN